MKKLFILPLAILLLLCFTLPLFAADSALTVDLRIEGRDENLFRGKVTAEQPQQNNISDILKLADSQSESLFISGLDYGYITEINGVKTGQAPSKKDGYTVTVNGVRVPFEEIDTYQLKNNDSIIIYYADNYGADMIFPMIDQKELDNGYVRFFYEKLSEDGKSSTVLPIAGASVIWYCGDAPFSYLTDSNGGIQIEKTALTSGSHRISIELDDENGTPMLLRLPPEFAIDVSVDIGDGLHLYFYSALALASLASAAVISASFFKRKDLI